MKQKTREVVLLCFAITVMAAGAPSAEIPEQGEATSITVNGGSVSFEVTTNVFATIVRGESSALVGGTQLRDGASGLRLEQLEAVVPVTSLRTGIKLRDEHMRKYIFQTEDGELPDVRFSAEKAECTQAVGGGAYICPASGILTIRGTARPFAIELKVTRSGEGFRVSGDGKLTLSTYGIERPSQFGVKTDDEVRIHLELSARNPRTITARAR
jgi:polyisoprenoid-binding protein YceI